MNEDYNKEICIREINENIKRVFNDEPLTRPLRVLRNNCEFKKRYDLAFNLKYNVRKCLNCRKEFKDINEEGYCSTNCKKEYKEYRENNKDKIAEKGKEYRENNKDKIAEKGKEYRENNKDKIKEYRENNKDKIAEKGKEYYENNKDKIAEKRKKRYVEKKFALVSQPEEVKENA